MGRCASDGSVFRGSSVHCSLQALQLQAVQGLLENFGRSLLATTGYARRHRQTTWINNTNTASHRALPVATDRLASQRHQRRRQLSCTPSPSAHPPPPRPQYHLVPSQLPPSCPAAALPQLAGCFGAERRAGVGSIAGVVKGRGRPGRRRAVPGRDHRRAMCWNRPWQEARDPARKALPEGLLLQSAPPLPTAQSCTAAARPPTRSKSRSAPAHVLPTPPPPESW